MLTDAERDARVPSPPQMAFPVPADASEGGMTLRDWFAGQAIIGLLANGSSAKYLRSSAEARRAYQVADSLMAEREEDGQA